MVKVNTLVIFWVEDMPPTQGGIQKRLAHFIYECSKISRLVLIQRNGKPEFSKRVKTITIDPGNFVEDSFNRIKQELLLSPEKNKFVYVSKIFEFQNTTHLKALSDISLSTTKTILRLASTRSAEFINRNQNFFNLSSIRIHCLNNYSYKLVSKWHKDVYIFNNYSPDPGDSIPLNSDLTYTFCGRIVPSKNIPSLLKAWKKFDALNKSLKIWGCYNKKYFDEHIRKRVEIDKTISYCGQYRIGAHSPFLESTFIVTPTLREGSSNLVIEAMSFRRIIIATRIPGVEDLLPKGYPLFIEEPYSRNEVLRALKKSAVMHRKSPDIIKDLSVTLRSYYKKNYSMDIELNELIDIFKTKSLEKINFVTGKDTEEVAEQIKN